MIGMCVQSAVRIISGGRRPGSGGTRTERASPPHYSDVTSVPLPLTQLRVACLACITCVLKSGDIGARTLPCTWYPYIICSSLLSKSGRPVPCIWRRSQSKADQIGWTNRSVQDGGMARSCLQVCYHELIRATMLFSIYVSFSFVFDAALVSRCPAWWTSTGQYISSALPRRYAMAHARVL